MALLMSFEQEKMTGTAEEKADYRVPFMLAALCHDMGKATTTRWNEEKQKWTAYGHDLAGLAPAKSYLESAANFTGNFSWVLKLVRWHMSHVNQRFSQKSVTKLASALWPATISDLVVLMEADCAGRPPMPPGLPRPVLEELVPLAKANGFMGEPDPNRAWAC